MSVVSRQECVSICQDFSKKLYAKKQSLVDDYEHSPVGSFNDENSSSKPLIRCLTFVEKAESLSPKSTMLSDLPVLLVVLGLLPLLLHESVVERLSRDLVAEKER
uniref:Uncharacterized protein n=1 Tax=Ditylenchus dipsaci TaxID=166011 RepID=A0A915E424_9BILA